MSFLTLTLEKRPALSVDLSPLTQDRLARVIEKVLILVPCSRHQ
jgi:hypothetical protein